MCRQASEQRAYTLGAKSLQRYKACRRKSTHPKEVYVAATPAEGAKCRAPTPASAPPMAPSSRAKPHHLPLMLFAHHQSSAPTALLCHRPAGAPTVQASGSIPRHNHAEARWKEWRSNSHRMYRGSEIMMEAGHRQFHRACSFPGRRFGFEDLHLHLQHAPAQWPLPDRWDRRRSHKPSCAARSERGGHERTEAYVLDSSSISAFLSDQITGLQRGSVLRSR
jgi:hypothetical protein